MSIYQFNVTISVLMRSRVLLRDIFNALHVLTGNEDLHLSF